MFLPTTRAELEKLKWDALDVILVTGDVYIDSPFVGVAVIGRVLANAGFRVGIIAQPDWHDSADISRLGEPNLFWGVSGGCMDSMVSNYTATKKKRVSDDLTAGGRNNRRPDRAAVVYANLIRRYFKETKPLILGGVEASQRRVAHYDYWSDSIRRSILFDARADALVYGMGEKAVIELARKLSNSESIKDIKGICYLSAEAPQGCIELPSFEDVSSDKKSFTRMFNVFYQNSDPVKARGLFQKHGPRYLVQNPPQPCLSVAELDHLYALDFTREVHPFYLRQGKVKAMDTIRFSICTHRGCYGECNFCSIGLHEGRTVISRSEDSIVKEAGKIASLPDFKGYIPDVGGSTANMYGIECPKKLKSGPCPGKRCLYPRVCPTLKPDHGRQISLLKKLRRIKGIRKVFVASGLRHDLLLADKKYGLHYLRELAGHHISGQLKIAPEHVAPDLLELMGKPKAQSLIDFKKIFEEAASSSGQKQFLTYYFIAAHPGCTDDDMHALKSFAARELKTTPRQVQIFTPLPSTYSALMYYTQGDPRTGRKIFVEKNTGKKQRQKDIIVGKTARS